MIVECDQCGAPLDVAEGQSLAKCAYCRSTQRVQNLRTTELRTPPNWQPPPVWHPPEHKRANFPEPLRFNPARAVIGAQIIQMLIGGIAVTGVIVAVVLVNVFGGHSPFSRGIDPTASPTLGVFDVGPNAPSGFIRQGVAGGPVQASRVGSSCRGYFPRTPHAVVRIRQPATLRITTTNDGTDLTMAIRAPDGTIRCDDDSGEGTNPMVQGGFGVGDHQVWIGTYSQNQSAAFSLNVQVEALGATSLAAGLAINAPPQVGAVDLETTAGAGYEHQAIAGGPIEGNTVNGACRGWYAAAPTATISVNKPRYVSITTQSDSDLTLLVRDANGNIVCDDDSGYGANPRVNNLEMPGVYQVWIGTYTQAQTASYTLSIATDPVPAATDATGMSPDAPPIFGTVDLATATTPQSFRGIVAGRIEGATLDASCGGRFVPVPHLALRTDAARRVRITASAQLPVEVLVRQPGAPARCIAHGSTSVSASVDLRPGLAQVWIGSRERERHVSFELSVAPMGRR